MLRYEPVPGWAFHNTPGLADPATQWLIMDCGGNDRVRFFGGRRAAEDEADRLNYGNTTGHARCDRGPL